MTEKSYEVADLNLAEDGQQQIDWVAPWMVVVNNLAKRFAKTGTFRGKRVAICIHLEAKTAYLAITMQRLGAEVWITSSNVLSTKDAVAAALAKNGVHVFAKHGAPPDEYRRFLHAIVEHKPHAIVDDGGDLCELLHEHPEYGDVLQGICEETTTGVNRLKEMADQGILKYPALAINSAQSKFLFDNRYGTGQSTWTAITHLTNKNIAGKVVVVIGYGWVGRGVAMRAHGLGAEVIITEIDPWKALEARMDGFRVTPLMEAAKIGDFFVTTTGRKHVLHPGHIAEMKSGAFLSNAGHFDYEIDINGLREMAPESKVVRENITEYTLPDQRKIYLLADGGIINIAGGLGHPVDIMDMSFALQLASVHYVLNHPDIPPGIQNVPREIDELVVREKLVVEQIAIDG